MNKRLKFLTVSLSFIILNSFSAMALENNMFTGENQIDNHSIIAENINVKTEKQKENINLINTIRAYRKSLYEEYDYEKTYSHEEIISNYFKNIFANKNYNELDNVIANLKQNKLLTDLDIKLIKNYINKHKTTLDKLNKSKEELKNIEDKNNKQFPGYNLDKFQYLRAYVTAELDKNTYEIILSEYDENYNLVLSDKHAILKTTDTAFKQRGWFELYVEFDKNIDVKLKEELGGFTQQIPVYNELSGQKLDNYFKLSENSSEVSFIEEDIESYTATLDSYIKAIISQIISIDNNAYVNKEEQNSKWKKYTNQIYGLEVEYPEILGKPMYSYNEDGAVFYNVGGIDIRAYASTYSLLQELSPEEYFNQLDYSDFGVKKIELKNFENVYLYSIDTECSKEREVIIFHADGDYHLKLSITDYRNHSQEEIDQIEKYFWNMVNTLNVLEGPRG